MPSRVVICVLAISAILTVPALADLPRPDASSGWLALDDTQPSQPDYYAPEPPPSASKPAPIPFHTIEGVAGGAITPMAYLSNPGPEGTTIGLPSVSFTYLQAGSKSVQSLILTETLFRRVELGYAASRFYLGSFPWAVDKATGIDFDRNHVYLHNFNVRAMLIEENSFDLPLPAVTIGAHFKYNEGIRGLDDVLAGTLGMLGFERSNGIDFTLTASKTFGDLFFGRPVIASVGLRNSQGSQLGYLGFSDDWSTTLEANVACLLTDWLTVAYEFRQKPDPYGEIAGVLGEEHNWHCVSLGWIVNEHTTILAGWTYLGTLANSDHSNGVAVQLKYEF